MSALRRCPNGHLLFDTKDGVGCLKPGCPSRVVGLFNKPKPKRKPKTEKKL